MSYLDQILDLPAPIIKIIIQNLLMVNLDFEKLSNAILDDSYPNLIEFLNELYISKENRNFLNKVNKKHRLGILMKGNAEITVADIEENPELIQHIKCQDITPEMVLAFRRSSKIDALLKYFEFHSFNLKVKEDIVRWNPQMIIHLGPDLDFFKRAFDINKNVIKVVFDFPIEIKKFILEKEILELKNSLANKEKKMKEF